MKKKNTFHLKGTVEKLSDETGLAHSPATQITILLWQQFNVMYLTKRYKNIQKLESAERLFRQSGTGEVFKAAPNLGVDWASFICLYQIQSDSDMRSG